MREYKFRGKIKDGKRAKELNLKVGDWVHGYYFHEEGLELINEESREFDRHYIINTPYIEEFIEVIPETISQFTGLYDENGKEIYEGDIVSFKDVGEEGYEYKEGYDFTNEATIIYQDGIFTLTDFGENENSYYSTNSSKEEILEDILRNGSCEVIGNIYDNKELLK